MKDKALRMALEALEAWLPTFPSLIEKQKTAITAIKQALAAPEEKYVYGTPLLDAMTKDYVQERNFCERCGKRLGSGIHTCTPPETEKNA
jgi:hypothetical protein